ASERAASLGEPPLFRKTYAGEQELYGVAAPDSTGIYWNDRLAEQAWVTEFSGGEEDQQLWGVIDHVNLAQPWQGFEEAVLFYRSVLSLSQESSTDVPGQRGLVRSLVMRT